MKKTDIIAYNMDALFEAAAAKGHVCVGLDTAADYLPPAGRRRAAPGGRWVMAGSGIVGD